MNRVNKIGIGSVQFGVNYGISNHSGQTMSKEVAAILKLAATHGVRYIDTASAYGNAEQVIGQHLSEGYRIVSKFMPPTTAGPIREQFQTSLNKLGQNHLYGYLAHRPKAVFEDKKQWAILQELKVEGKIEKVGFSFNQPEEIEEMYRLDLNPDLIQVPYNFFDRRFELLMQQLKRKGCEIHTRSTFLQGLFFVDANELPEFFASVRPIIHDLQQQYKEQLSGMLLKYALDAPFIDVVIIGIENRQQLKENIESLKIQVGLDYRLPKIDGQILMPSCWPTK